MHALNSYFEMSLYEGMTEMLQVGINVTLTFLNGFWISVNEPAQIAF